jgi:hypothetical protein
MIVDIGTWSDVYLKYDTDTLEYIINPNGDSLGMIAMGYNDTRMTQAQLVAVHDGIETFTGRADFIGHYASFPFTLNMYGTITEPVKYKKYVDRDPVIFYTGLTTLAETDLTEDPENPLQVYYDAPFNVDTGYIYAPYVPLQLTPTMYNPFNFAPVKGIMTRYAKKVVNNRFYGSVRVDGLQVFNAGYRRC